MVMVPSQAIVICIEDGESKRRQWSKNFMS